MSPFIQNLWYLAAWTHEVPEAGFLARRLLGTSWLMYQCSDGEWAMLANRCPHRFAPLSRGQRVGDTIRCGYHGLGFDSSGKCVYNPFSSDIPSNALVKTLPVVAKHGAIWFWPGDSEKADPSRIPDFSFLDSTQQVLAHMLMDANYELLTDNLMDLSHTEFLHRGSFGTNGSLLEHGKQSVKTDDSGAIWNNWDMNGVTAPGWATAMVGPEERVDQWLHMRWHAPAAMALEVGLAKANTEKADLVVPVMVDPHILTPESESSTHYFYTHQATPEAKLLAERVFQEEDEPMIRAVFEEMDGRDFWDMRPLVLASDAAALRARRRLIKLRSEEGAAVPEAARQAATSGDDRHAEILK